MNTDLIQKNLKESFPDAEISLSDYKHDGAHLLVNIVSSKFLGLSLVEQHRLVYVALGKFLQSGEVHALKIKTSSK